MTFLPVVERELRVAARLPGTHWVRLVAAFIALGIGGWIMAIPIFRNTPGMLGIWLFGSMSVLVNLYALVIGVLRTSDCLSEEKREGTLGLLFLTDLKGYDIILGKLAATSLNGFYGMLAAIALCLATTIILKMTLGESEQSKLKTPKSKVHSSGVALITFIPLAWLLHRFTRVRD